MAMTFQSMYNRAVARAKKKSFVLPYELWEPHLLDRVKLRDIKENQCHWPYGDPYENSFAMCGLPVFRRGYCKGHYKRATSTGA